MLKSAILRFLGSTVRILGLALLGALAVLGTAYCCVQFNFNLHAVEPGLVYRSGQMTPQELTRLIRSSGVRSVINLRGAHIGEGWYDQELRSAQASGVLLINYPISARSELTIEQMKRISLLIHDCPKPVLIHCGSGADRTGLACALYCVDAGMSPQAAREQLSFCYGHFPHLLWEDARAMDLSLERYLGQMRGPLAGVAR